MSSPANIRRAMELANELMKNGIEFVPVAVFSESEREKAALQSGENLARAMQGADDNQQEGEMSYCRWSSDDWRCDLYAYEGCDGLFHLHVASRRVPGEVPRAKLTMGSLKDGSYMKAHAEQVAYVRRSEREPIGLSQDGASFALNDAGELARKMIELQGEGYRVPAFAIESAMEDADNFNQYL